MEHVNHERVIPRDFFNEAKLLKCMGQLSLKINDLDVPEGVTISIEESGEPFRIELTEGGYLYVANYRVTINDVPVFIGTVYNSKSAYPLECDYTPMFTDSGEFEHEFIEWAREMKSL